MLTTKFEKKVQGPLLDSSDDYLEAHPEILEGLLAQLGMGKREPLPEDDTCVVNANLQGKTEQENRQLAHIINEMCKSEAGREVIQTALKNNFKFIFDTSVPQAYGYADPEHKVCAMNPRFTVEDLIATMAHELRHVKQFDEPLVKKCCDGIDIDANSYYKCLRAMEADASSQECLVAWQLKEQGLDGAWRNFERDFPELAEPFKAVMADYKGPEDVETLKKARTAVFLGWYENGPRRNGYDKDYAKAVLTMMYQGTTKEFAPELKRIDARDMVAVICQENGNVYFSEDPDMLNKEHYIAVSADTKETLKRGFSEYEKMHGEGSAHLDDIPVADLTERFVPHAVSARARQVALAVKQERASQAIAANRRDVAPFALHMMTKNRSGR